MIGAIGAAALAVLQSNVTHPAWLMPPSAELLWEPMPPFAWTFGIDGRVTLECRTLPRPSAPQDCQVVSVSATGLGFEAKALQVAATGLIQPRTFNGVATPGRISFRVRFNAEDWKDTANTYRGPAPSLEQMRLARLLVARLSGDSAFEKYEAYPELEPVRRARVNQWVRELLPVDEETQLESAATFFARLMSEAELKTAVATGQPPRREPSIEEIEKAMLGLDGQWDQAAVDQIRARYCADYDCGSGSD